MGTGTNTTYFNLDKLDRDEQTTGDSVRKLRTIQNGNMDIIDGALYNISVSAASGGYQFSTASVNYTLPALSSIVDVDASAGTVTINAPATVPTGGTPYIVIKNDSSIFPVIVNGNGNSISGSMRWSADTQYARFSFISAYSDYRRLY